MKTAKEGIKQQASHSEIYGKMHAVFVEMDPAPTVSTLIYTHIYKYIYIYIRFSLRVEFIAVALFSWLSTPGGSISIPSMFTYHGR